MAEGHVAFVVSDFECGARTCSRSLESDGEYGNVVVFPMHCTDDHGWKVPVETFCNGPLENGLHR